MNYENVLVYSSLVILCTCYAQVAKSPNDHQAAGIRCKSKRVFITKLELGLPPLLTQRLRRGAPSFGLHCLYREYSGERVTKGVFRLKDCWLVTLFYRVVCGFLIGFFTSTIDHYFQGKSQREIITSKVNHKFLNLKSRGLPKGWLARVQRGKFRQYPKSKSVCPVPLQNGVLLQDGVAQALQK